MAKTEGVILDAIVLAKDALEQAQRGDIWGSGLAIEALDTARDLVERAPCIVCGAPAPDHDDGCMNAPGLDTAALVDALENLTKLLDTPDGDVYSITLRRAEIRPMVLAARAALHGAPPSDPAYAERDALRVELQGMVELHNAAVLRGNKAREARVELIAALKAVREATRTTCYRAWVIADKALEVKP